jgi:hypothetical protein
MPLQNRVRPDGAIVALPERGLFMGNRGGQLHRPDKTLTGRRWVSRAWIACVLSYKDRHETIMADGHYTQLFFLDEATALAAGHRPCALCRRADFRQFAATWAEHHRLSAPPRATVMDTVLHAERLAGRDKRTFLASIDKLPAGAMVLINHAPHLVQANGLLAWSSAGYTPASVPPPAEAVPVLTPPSIVGLLRAGYAPMLHPSAITR